MNKSILEEIYFSDCGPSETMVYTEEYLRLNKEADEYFDKLFAILGKEPGEWLDTIWLLEGGIHSEYGLMGFREGIRFAFRLLAETMGSSKLQ